MAQIKSQAVAHVVAEVTDAFGNVVGSAPVTFASSDEAVLTVASTGDATADATSVGPVGVSTVTATLASDSSITASEEVTVVAGDPAALKLTFTV